MLSLAVVNAIGVVSFGALYALGEAGMLSQPVAVAGLAVLLAVLILVWVRTEERHRSLAPVSRLGRIVVGLLIVLVATPGILVPLFRFGGPWRPERGGAVALALTALILVVFVNIMGILIALVRSVFRPRSDRDDLPEA